MPRIHKLSDIEAQKIAAGEVVERPINVVKELIENSLDAQATSISVYLEKAGKKSIRIVDSGCGMSEADAELCFLKHTTSKISTIKDLDTLETFGFRGEALSSICTISNTTITTKDQDSETGTSFKVENEKLVDKKIVSCPQGTDIKIENLFYNLPAREKFLKRDETELNHIISFFQAACLSYPHVHFKLYHNQKLLFNCPPTKDLKNRCAQVWDHTAGAEFIDIQPNSNQEYSVQGAITHYHYGRYDKSCILFFVNNRLVRNIKLSRALLKGYEHVLYYGKFPAAAIFISTNTFAHKMPVPVRAGMV